MIGKSRIPDLSKAIAAYLTRESEGRFFATHNSDVVYTMQELAELKVDVWPVSLERARITREDWSRLPSLNIAVQRRAPTQEEKDILTNLMDDILDSLLGRCFVDDKYYCAAGGFGGSEIMDRFEHYDKNVFVSVLTVNFQWIV